MKKLPFFAGLFFIAATFIPFSGGAYSYRCLLQKVAYSPNYYTEQIPYQGAVMPTITIANVEYGAPVADTAGIKVGSLLPLSIKCATERKQNSAVVSLQAYVRHPETGAVCSLQSLTLDVKENTDASGTQSEAAKQAKFVPSVLASGTWYKIAVTQTGFYKIDRNFLTSIGIDGASANLANLHVHGYGGYMLPENNAIDRPYDLPENATVLSSDGSFVLFYANGTMAWNWDSSSKCFKHQKNLYADTAYYFITLNDQPGLRVAKQTASSAANVTVSSFDYRDVHEEDLLNPAMAGRTWYGELFAKELSSFSQTFHFNFGAPIDSLRTAFSFGTTSTAGGSTYDITLNGGSMLSVAAVYATSLDKLMSRNVISTTAALNNASADININFTPSATSAKGYLDYIELQGRRPLSLSGSQMTFRDSRSVGAGKVASYTLQNATAGTMVWDVTNSIVPKEMLCTLGSGGLSFTQDAAALHEFAAITDADAPTPIKGVQIPNQNLHSEFSPQLIIVTHPAFLASAQKLKEYHETHDNMKVMLATTTQVYNEFSSGAQDICAIRDFARMYYKRAGTDSASMPQYLQLFGGGSYDYKYRTAGNSNYVPTYESINDSNSIYAYSTDDFYGFLDDSENFNDRSRFNVLDIAVGRIPARSTDDAAVAVNKIINYKKPSTLGPWRLNTMFVADNNDLAGNHMDDAETMAAITQRYSNNLSNIQKVYVNAIPVISTPAGPRCPNANLAINDQIYKGCLMVNYNGHGSPQVWTEERILTSADYGLWQNGGKLPFMVTATCDFGQFDRPQFVSAAEQLVLKDNGGAIALITTTQAVYSFYNNPMNIEYLTAQYTKNKGGKWNTFGDAVKIGKNLTFVRCTTDDEFANFNKFALLGDPALTPNFPENNITIDSLQDGVTLTACDTIKALGKYTLYGSVRSYSNNSTLTAFTGTVYVSIYDKPRKVNTITAGRTFKMQDNLIYKGKVSVKNGLFKVMFIAPRDINYYMGLGKVSTYAENGITDAAGSDTSFYVGSYSEHPATAVEKPTVSVYVNDSTFMQGGITGSNTSLYAVIQSETGINVSGNAVGHDLTAIIDNNTEQAYILNDYYETAPDTYQKGFVNYPLTGLADGKHTLTLRAWDVNDNMGEGSVEFTVVNGKIAAIQQLANYPNPFANSTQFLFEHNHPLETLNVKIQIYHADGTIVKTIDENITPTGSRTASVSWNGTNDNGSPLPQGLYLYRLQLTTKAGVVGTAYQKLIIAR